MRQITMYVKSITASCSTKKATIERKLQLASDLEAWSPEVQLSLVQTPELEMLGSGDEVRVTIEFVRPALEVELLRQAELEEDEA